MRRALRIASAVIAVACGCARSALAVDQGEWQLGLAAGYQRVRAESAGGVRLEGWRGVSDALALHLTLGASARPSGKALAMATGGVSYALDVLRVIPFAEAGVAWVAVGGDGSYAGGEVGLGGMYLVDRRWSVALLGRYAYLPLRLTATGGSAPGLLTLTALIARGF